MVEGIVAQEYTILYMKVNSTAPCSSIRTIQILRDLIDLDKVGYGSQKCPHKQYSPMNMLCDFPHYQDNPKQQMTRLSFLSGRFGRSHNTRPQTSAD